MTGLGVLPYAVGVVLIAVGLYVLVGDDNLLKKVLGLNVFQTGIFLVFILSGYRTGGRPPLGAGAVPAGAPSTNPLPQVLMLTAIVVGVSVTAVALALIVRIYGVYGTLDEGEIKEAMGE